MTGFSEDAQRSHSTVEPRSNDTPQPWILVNIMNISECPDGIPIDFSTLKSPQQRTPCFSVQWTLTLVPFESVQ